MPNKAKNKDDADAALSRVEDLARQGSSMVMEKIKDRPLWCVGIAVGAGFLLGGGLASPAALRLLRKSIGTVLHLTVMPLVVSRLQDAVTEKIGRGDEHAAA